MLGRSVAIIEDDEDARSAFSEILKDQGLHVREFKNGKEAMQAIQAGELPSLILCDLVMPEMNGWQFLEAWSYFADKNEIAKSVPVAVVSATPDYGTLEHQAVVEIIPKPVGLESLLTLVQRYFGNASGVPVLE